MTGAAGGEAEGVDDHVALVWGDGHQLVVHVLLLTHSRVSGQEKRLKIVSTVKIDYSDFTFQSPPLDTCRPLCDTQ